MSTWTVTVPHWLPIAYLAVGFVVLALSLREAWRGIRRTTWIENHRTGKRRDLTTRETMREVWRYYGWRLPVLGVPTIVLGWPVLAARFWWRAVR